MKHCGWTTMAFWMPLMVWNKAMGSGRSSCMPSSMQTKGCTTTSTSSRVKEQSPAGRKNIVELASESGRFERLIEALEKAELVDTLKGTGPFTVFAPSDEAFSKLPGEVLDAALQDIERLRSILTYHVVPGRFTSDTLQGVDSLKTLQGTPLRIDTSLGVKAGAARVVKADIAAENGVIHAIDSVLLPE